MDDQGQPDTRTPHVFRHDGKDYVSMDEYLRLNQRYRDFYSMQWVSVEERLPEMGVRVMVAHDVDGWVGVGERILTGAYLHWEDDGEDLHEPTHWMPLPSPPPKKD